MIIFISVDWMEFGMRQRAKIPSIYGNIVEEIEQITEKITTMCTETGQIPIMIKKNHS